VWCKFTAGDSGVASIRVAVHGSWAVYQGGTLAALTPLVPINTINGIYQLTAGTTYMVVANNPAGYQGSARFRLTRLNLAQYPNDYFASRTPIGLGSYIAPRFDYRYSISSTSNYSADTWQYAITEAGEPTLESVAGNGETIWWEFTAGEAGWYGTQGVQAFTGSTIELLQLITPTILEIAHNRWYHLAAGQTIALRRTLPELGPQWVSVFRADHYELFHLNSGMPSDQQGFQDKPSGDGITNLMKFALGLDPSKALSADPDKDRFPKIVEREDGRFEMVYTLDLWAVNHLYEEELSTWLYVGPRYSTNMTTWYYISEFQWYEPDAEETARFKEIRHLISDYASQVFTRLEIGFVDYEGND